MEGELKAEENSPLGERKQSKEKRKEKKAKIYICMYPVVCTVTMLAVVSHPRVLGLTHLRGRESIRKGDIRQYRVQMSDVSDNRAASSPRRTWRPWFWGDTERGVSCRPEFDKTRTVKEANGHEPSTVIDQNSQPSQPKHLDFTVICTACSTYIHTSTPPRRPEPR